MALNIATIAQPEPPDLKSALSKANNITPIKPISKPNHCEPVKRSRNHHTPIKAVKIGVVAFKIEAKPAVMDNNDHAIKTKGIAALNTPTNNIAPACCHNNLTCLCQINRGSNNNDEIATRNQIIGKTPNSGAA